MTTLTKKMSEDLTDYLLENGIRTRYLHSEVDTLQRIQLLRELRHPRLDRGHGHGDADEAGLAHEHVVGGDAEALRGELSAEFDDVGVRVASSSRVRTARAPCTERPAEIARARRTRSRMSCSSKGFSSRQVGATGFEPATSVYLATI